jgi:prophage regulatory protein
MQSRPRKILRLAQVRERTGLSTSSIYAKIAAGTFPKQVPLGPHSVGWVDQEIDAHNEACIAARDAAKPEGDNWRPLGDAAARVISKVKP